MLGILWGLPGGGQRVAADELLALQHRRILEKVAAAGHVSVITEELEGITDATGLHEGALRNLDAVFSQLSSTDPS
jgi:hypothetical protein